MKNKFLIPLLSISILGFLLRFIFLSDFPSAFSRDEAYLGYNAYSIAQTGKDINSNFLPIFIESFLYTPAGYSYFSIPFIKMFGLSVFSVRFVSALFGALTIPLIYFVTMSILRVDFIYGFKRKQIELVAVISSFFLAITPWHINLSRTASVSTLVVFFILLGILFFTKFVTLGKKSSLLFTFAFFLVSLFLYIAPSTFLPMFLIFLYCVFHQKIKYKKTFFLYLFIFLIPIFIIYTSPQLSLRVQSLNITKAPIVSLLITELTSIDGVNKLPPLIARFYHNKANVTADLVLLNYFDHLSYRFLFSDGGMPDRYKVPGSPLLYLAFLALSAIGIHSLIKEEGRIKWVLIGWVLLAPIGSSFASDDVPNLQRTLYMLPPLLIISAIGFIALLNEINKKRIIPIVVMAIIVGLLTYQSIFYLHQYYIHENSYRPWYRQDGYEQLIQKVNKHKVNFRKVVITNRESAPTIFFLFFNKFDPALAQIAIGKSNIKDTDRINFDIFKITEEECPVRVITDPQTKKKILIGEKEVLYVNSGLCKFDEYQKKVRILDTIRRTDGSNAFYLLNVL